MGNLIGTKRLIPSFEIREDPDQLGPNCVKRLLLEETSMHKFIIKS